MCTKQLTCLTWHMFSLIDIAIGIIYYIDKLEIVIVKIEKRSAKIVNKPYLIYQRIKMIKMN